MLGVGQRPNLGGDVLGVRRRCHRFDRLGDLFTCSCRMKIVESHNICLLYTSFCYMRGIIRSIRYGFTDCKNELISDRFVTRKAERMLRACIILRDHLHDDVILIIF